MLVTCRYRLPDDDRYLVRVLVLPLSAAELSRLPAAAGRGRRCSGPRYAGHHRPQNEILGTGGRCRKEGQPYITVRHHGG